jgi:hypothetical protein
MSFYQIEKKILNGDKLSDADLDFIRNRTEFYWNNHPDVAVRFPRWNKVLAWVAGYQHIDYNLFKKELEPVKLKGRRVFINRLKPILRTMLGKLRGIEPQFGVVPNTREYEDIQAATVGDSLLEALADKINFEKIRKEFFSWLLLTNRACVRVFWDETKEGIIGYETIIDEETKEPNKVVVKEKGDVNMEVISPFNYRHDPLYSSPDKWRWFLYGELVSREELADAYDIDVSELKQETELTQGIISPVIFSKGQEELDFYPALTSSVDEDTTIKYELWTPNMYFIIGGGKVLDYGVNAEGIIPFFAYEDMTIPIGNYEKEVAFNDSIFKDLIAAQHEYNRQMTLISLAIERASKIKVLAPLNALLNKNQVYDESGLTVIDYAAQLGEPHQLRLDTLPPLTIPYKQELERDLENVSGVHEVSFGRLPERASHASGVLVNLLLEQDDSVLDPIIKEVDAVFSKAWSYALEIVQKNYILPRLLKLVGRDKQDSVFAFAGADLRNNTDVLVTTNVSLPKSRIMRSEWVIRLAQLGLIKDPKLILELLEFGGAKQLYETELMHEKKALRENNDIEKNPAILPQEEANFMYILDDHETHLKIHLRLRLSEQYSRFTTSQKQALEAHIQEHLQYIQQAMQQQQQMLQQANPKSTPEEAGIQTPPAGQSGNPTEGNTVGEF